MCHDSTPGYQLLPSRRKIYAPLEGEINRRRPDASASIWSIGPAALWKPAISVSPDVCRNGSSARYLATSAAAPTSSDGIWKHHNTKAGKMDGPPCQRRAWRGIISITISCCAWQLAVARMLLSLFDDSSMVRRGRFPPKKRGIQGRPGPFPPSDPCVEKKRKVYSSKRRPAASLGSTPFTLCSETWGFILSALARANSWPEIYAAEQFPQREISYPDFLSRKWVVSCVLLGHSQQIRR